jgi:hypothetical protein
MKLRVQRGGIEQRCAKYKNMKANQKCEQDTKLDQLAAVSHVSPFWRLFLRFRQRADSANAGGVQSSISPMMADDWLRPAGAEA